MTMAKAGAGSALRNLGLLADGGAVAGQPAPSAAARPSAPSPNLGPSNARPRQIASQATAASRIGTRGRF